MKKNIKVLNFKLEDGPKKGNIKTAEKKRDSSREKQTIKVFSSVAGGFSRTIKSNQKGVSHSFLNANICLTVFEGT